MQLKLRFFPTHHDRVEKHKIDAQNCARYPGPCGDGCRKRQNSASEIEGIAGVGVRPGNCENFLLVKMAGGAGTDE
jgi:hypothetical protein